MNLREIRKARNLTQREVAESIWCSVTVYSRYETGERQPPIDILIRLSDFYGVTLDYLVGKKELAFEGLSEYEKALIAAARKADDRARKDAIILLGAHRSSDGSANQKN